MKPCSEPRVLVVGSLNQDLVLRVDRMPEAGENRIGPGLSEFPGGKGGNQAVAASKFGAQVAFCGCVGADAAGSALLDSLARAGVETAYVAKSDRVSTGRAFIVVESNGQNRIIVYPGANQELRAEHIERVFATTDFDAVLVSLETASEPVDTVIRLAQKRDIPVVLDAGPAQSYDLHKLRGLAILSPNETETTALTGEPCNSWEEAEVAARHLKKETGARCVVIKMGARGALVCDKNGARRFSAFVVNAIDATAAGDAFTSALTVEWLRTGGVRTAMPVALAAGAITATRMGAQPALPDYSEVLAFLYSRNAPPAAAVPLPNRRCRAGSVSLYDFARPAR
jgi:ribokinase